MIYDPVATAIAIGYHSVVANETRHERENAMKKSTTKTTQTKQTTQPNDRDAKLSARRSAAQLRRFTTTRRADASDAIRDAMRQLVTIDSNDADSAIRDAYNALSDVRDALMKSIALLR
jgi:hypothetical protein